MSLFNSVSHLGILSTYCVLKCTAVIRMHVAHADSITICNKGMLAFQITSKKLEEESVP